MSYKIISKFLKDISFEIPSVQAYVLLEKEVSKYNLNFDIKSKPHKTNIIEVNTILKVSPNEDVKHKIFAEINCTALVSIENTQADRKELEKIILVNVPQEVYPTLYETFIFLFQKAGIKNIEIDKNVDFEKLYNQRKNN
tara:strand:+ start:599 stop:1018 length:420 start_codon:yes stop_codon:yes gene_type:complete